MANPDPVAPDERAPLPPLPAPTAHWREDLPLRDGGCVNAGIYYTADQMHAYGRACIEAAAPSEPIAAAVLTPLTEAQIAEIIAATFADGTYTSDDIAFVRAIEAAHGIGAPLAAQPAPAAEPLLNPSWPGVYKNPTRFGAVPSPAPDQTAAALRELVESRAAVRAELDKGNADNAERLLPRVDRAWEAARAALAAAPAGGSDAADGSKT